MPGERDQAGEVFAFWFVETLPRQWFAKDAAFDGLVRDRFLGLTRQALAGECDAWGMEPPGGLAVRDLTSDGLTPLQCKATRTSPGCGNGVGCSPTSITSRAVPFFSYQAAFIGVIPCEVRRCRKNLRRW
jgi:hypothetical protein